MKLSLRDRLTKAHAAIMRHTDFCLYSGVIMMGDTSIKPGKDMPAPTAYTDGVNTVYSEEMVSAMNDKQLRCVILHENLHKAFLHVPMYGALFKKQPMIANGAADYFVNQIIRDTDPTYAFVEPPPNGVGGTGAVWLQDDKYRGWPFKRIYDDLMQDAKAKGNVINMPNFDGHGTDPGGKPMSREEQKALQSKIEQLLREGKNLAGMRKGNVNRSIDEFLEPKVDWRAALLEFVQSIAAGKDKSDWRRLNRRFVYQGLYFPSLVSERIGEIAVGIDTSGSIGEREIAEFAGELASICEITRPELVRVIWWDTEVHGEQVFTESNYDSMRTMLKPAGGGGTDGNYVPRYIKKQRIKPECVIMMTDGYLGPVTGFECPSLWFITVAKDYVPAEGKAVEFSLDD